MKPHWVAIGTALLVLTVCVSQFGLHAAAPEEAEPSDVPEPSITAVVTGYATATVIDDPDCVQDNCNSQLSIRFNILSTENGPLRRFLEQVAGNAYAGPDFVNLGCLANGSIFYQNASDAFGMQELRIPEEVSTAILRSTQQSPLMLKIQKFPLSTGSDGPICYSHFTTVELAR